MSKVKSSPPLKKSNKSSNLKGIGIGCSILVGFFLVGVVIAVVVFRPSLSSNFFGNNQAATAPTGLADNTSPELLMARREEEEVQLNSYGWIDKEANVVRIPIDQAMALVAERGLPVGSEETEAAATEETSPAPTPAPAAGGAATATPGPDSAGEPATEEPSPAEPSPAVPPEPTVNLAEVSFQEHVLPIFERSCVQCHGGERPEGGLRTEEGLSLKTHEDIMAGSWNGSVVEPGDVENSYLIEQIVTGRMPKEGPDLSPAEIEIITAWVEAGAPDN